MEPKLEVTMDEYLPLRDTQAGDPARRIKAGRAFDGDQAGQ